MNPADSETPIKRRCERICHWASWIAMAIGVSTMVGWILGIETLISVLPGLAWMKFNTAVGLTLGGASLRLYAPACSRVRCGLGIGCAAAAAFIGAYTLAEYGGWASGLDPLFYHASAAGNAPMRMTAITAFNLCCLGAALLALRFRKGWGVAHLLAGIIVIAALTAIVGFFYGVAPLYRFGYSTAAALHTAIALIVLGVGIWCGSSEHGFMRVVTGRGLAGTLVRRYGLAAIILPIVIGWLRIQGTRHGWFAMDVGPVVVAMLNVTAFSAILWIGARWLQVAERRQMKTQEGLRESEERLNLVVEQLTEGLVICDLQGRMLHWNKAGLDLHGFVTKEEGLRMLPEFSKVFEVYQLNGEPIPFEDWPLPRVFRGEEVHNFELLLRRTDAGWEKILNCDGGIVRGKDATPLAFLTITDVTQQKRAEAAEAEATESLRQAHVELEERVLRRTSELAAANADLQKQMTERARAEHANEKIMQNSLDVICTFDSESRFVTVSSACEKLWGYLPAELLGRRFLDLVDPEDFDKTVAAAESIMSGHPVTMFENRYLRADGATVPVVWSAQWSEEEQIMFCVARDITEHKRVQRELIAAKEAAEAASRAKSDFLANMSHEIRTPMNGVLGMTELLLDTPLEAEQREYLEMAKFSADTLLGLINDILDFSKIEAGKLVLETIEFSLRDAVEKLLKQLNLQAGLKNLALKSDIAPEIPDRITGDPTRLGQVLINLVANAIKFTHVGGVTLSVALESAAKGAVCLQFTVRDTGIGIAPEKQAVIFEAFSQADSTTTRNYGGTGLGLAIASRLVEAMKGRIWVESTLGKGTTFRFTATFAALDALSPHAAQIVARPTGGAAQDGRGLRILLAEDNPINRALATGILEKRGHRLSHAANGQEAVEAAANENFDLIFMDLQMPKMDGFEATRLIRESEQARGGHTPIVAMTAHAMAGDRERCLAAGMDDYISKPIQRPDLFALLDRVSGAKNSAAPAQSASAENDSLEVWNRDQLLDQVDGDEALLDRLTQLFETNAPRLVEEMRHALEHDDASGLSRAAHSLLGPLGSFGATKAHQLCLQIEKSGQVKDLAAAKQAFATLDAEVVNVLGALR